MSAVEALRTDTLPSSTDDRLRGQTNPQHRSEISVSESLSQSSALQVLGVAGRQQCPSAPEEDECVLCVDHEVVLEADSSANVPKGAGQSGYKGRKCPKCQRRLFFSHQGSIPMHQLHFFGCCGESRRKTKE